jgi:two-component system OmpR family sensor kinase
MSARSREALRLRAPLVRRAKRSLQRRILWGFVAAIFATGLTVTLVGQTVLDRGQGLHREARGARAFAAARIAEAWSIPERRAALVDELSVAVGAGVSLVDPAGVELVEARGGCVDARHAVSIGPETAPLGALRLCTAGDRRRATFALVLAIGAACCVLWAAAAAIARRLARPIAELAVVAERLGEGDLSARFALGACRSEPGKPARVDAEVDVLGSAFNTMAERIESQIRSQRELLAHVSHELRTPLARIRLLTELARDGGEPAGQLDEIDREVVEIDGLVGALLADARLEFGTIERARVDAVELARRALERAGEPAEKLRAPGASLPIEADPTLVARALANLLENARAHGDGVDALVVERAPDGLVAFAVEDRGPGLPPGDVQALFEPFARRARDADRGSLGLGLALVRRVAEAHGGHILAEGREGGGARVGLAIASA